MTLFWRSTRRRPVRDDQRIQTKKRLGPSSYGRCGCGEGKHQRDGAVPNTSRCYSHYDVAAQPGRDRIGCAYRKIPAAQGIEIASFRGENPPRPALLLSMALFRTRSAALFGIEAHLIDVEVDMYPGGNSRDFITVGMPDTAVRESRERIKSALLNSGFGYPNKSVTINLAPANVRKEGAGFDLPMALGILGATGVIGASEEYLFVGELSLDGSLRPVRGALSIAVAAQREALRNLVVPADNAPEACMAEGVRVFGLRHLAEVVRLLQQPD